MACHVPAPARRKWSGSSANAPRIETTESPCAGALTVRRTIAPGCGCAGSAEIFAACACVAADHKQKAATNAARFVFTVIMFRVKETEANVLVQPDSHEVLSKR